MFELGFFFYLPRVAQARCTKHKGKMYYILVAPCDASGSHPHQGLEHNSTLLQSCICGTLRLILQRHRRLFASLVALAALAGILKLPGYCGTCPTVDAVHIEQKLERICGETSSLPPSFPTAFRGLHPLNVQVHHSFAENLHTTHIPA